MAGSLWPIADALGRAHRHFLKVPWAAQHVFAAGSVRVPSHASNSLNSFVLRAEDRSTEHCGSEFDRSARHAQDQPRKSFRFLELAQRPASVSRPVNP